MTTTDRALVALTTDPFRLTEWPPDVGDPVRWGTAYLRRNDICGTVLFVEFHRYSPGTFYAPVFRDVLMCSATIIYREEPRP